MRFNLKLNRVRFVSDGAGQYGAPIDNLEILWLCLESEVDGVGLSKFGIDKA